MNQSAEVQGLYMVHIIHPMVDFDLIQRSRS